MYFICKRPLFWTRPRGPRLAYNITECIGYVKHAPFIKMCNEQIPQCILVIPNGQTRLQYKTDQYVLISSNRFSIEKKRKKYTHGTLNLREFVLNDDEDQDLQGLVSWTH